MELSLTKNKGNGYTAEAEHMAHYRTRGPLIAESPGKEGGLGGSGVKRRE